MRKALVLSFVLFSMTPQIVWADGNVECDRQVALRNAVSDCQAACNKAERAWHDSLSEPHGRTEAQVYADLTSQATINQTRAHLAAMRECTKKCMLPYQAAQKAHPGCPY